MLIIRKQQYFASRMAFRLFKIINLQEWLTDAYLAYKVFIQPFTIYGVHTAG